MQILRKTLSVCAVSSRPRSPRRYKVNRWQRVGVLTTALGFASLTLGTALRADTFNWIANPANTLFQNSLNWDKGSVPVDGDDAVNSTSNVIDFLTGAGSRTINSFTNSGGGTFNIDLSDPNGQTFIVNGNVNNMLTASVIDITGGNNLVTFNNNGGTLTNAGIIRVHDNVFLGSGADDINNSGTITGATDASINIFQSGSASGTLTNSGTISALSGSLVSVFNNTTTNAVNALLSADGFSANFNSNLSIGFITFTNNGTIRATNGGGVMIAALNPLNNPGIFTNNNLIVADGTGAASAPSVALSGASLINNANGIIAAQGGAASTSVDFTNVDNRGMLTAGDGTSLLLKVDNALTNSGTISGTSQATFSTNVAGDFTNSGTVDFGPGTFGANTTSGAFTNAGTIRAEGGTVSITNATTIMNSGIINVRQAVGALTLNGSSLTNSGTISASLGAKLNGTIDGAVTNTATGTILSTGGTFATNNTTGAFVNNGTVDANGGSITAVNPTSASNAGSLTAEGGGSVTVNNSTALSNTGQVRAGNSSQIFLNGGENQTGANSRTQVDPTGTLTVGGTGLTLGTGAAGNGGKLTGNGTVVGNVFNTSGAVTAGSDTSAGHLTATGNYTQGANGAYILKLGGTGQGTSYDLFSVSGTATLAGTLQVQLLNTFTPFTGETFNFLTYGSHVGAFDSIFSSDTSHNYTVSYSGSVATLSVSAVPETGTLVSLSLLMAGSAFALRRKRRQVGC